MKRVDTIARVRRAFYVHRWSVRKIVRERHVLRNTVRKIQRSDETETRSAAQWCALQGLDLARAMSAIRRKLKGSDDSDRQMVHILACVPEDGL